MKRYCTVENLLHFEISGLSNDGFVFQNAIHLVSYVFRHSYCLAQNTLADLIYISPTDQQALRVCQNALFCWKLHHQRTFKYVCIYKIFIYLTCFINAFRFSHVKIILWLLNFLNKLLYMNDMVNLS